MDSNAAEGNGGRGDIDTRRDGTKPPRVSEERAHTRHGHGEREREGEVLQERVRT